MDNGIWIGTGVLLFMLLSYAFAMWLGRNRLAFAH